MIEIQLCRSCNAKMLMLKHAETGKVNPINAGPSKDGNISVDRENGTYRILTKDILSVARESGATLHLSHFVSCPDAKRFRR